MFDECHDCGKLFLMIFEVPLDWTEIWVQIACYMGKE